MITTTIVFWLLQGGAAGPEIDLTALGPWAAVIMLLIRVVQEQLAGSRKVLAQALASLAAVEKHLVDSRIAKADSRTGLLAVDQVNALHRHLLVQDTDGNVRSKARVDTELLGARLDSYASENQRIHRTLTEILIAMREAADTNEARMSGLEATVLDTYQNALLSRRKEGAKE